MLTAIIDYESGNLHSADKAFQKMAREGAGGEVVVTDKAEVVAKADRIVLPGDGAFPACAAALRGKDGVYEALLDAVENRGVPFMGICVGMQLMARKGHEYEEADGLGWVDGEVLKIVPTDPTLKVPHMGWNDLVIEQAHPVLEGVETGDHAYFVHSYQIRMADPSQRIAYCDYGEEVTAIVGSENRIGLQFHPEKSAETGLRMISNFLRWTP